MPKQSDLPPEPTILPLPKEERGSRGKPEKPSKPKAQTQPRTGRKQRQFTDEPIAHTTFETVTWAKPDPNSPTPKHSYPSPEELQTFVDKERKSFHRPTHKPSAYEHTSALDDGEVTEKPREDHSRVRARMDRWQEWLKSPAYKPAKGMGWGGIGYGELKDIDYDQYRRAWNRRAFERMTEIMETSENEGFALNAAKAIQDRVEGTAIARTMESPNGETVDEVRIVDASSLSPEERAVLRKVLQEKLAERAPKAIGEP